MNSVAPQLWRTIGRELFSSPLFCRKASLQLTPPRRILQCRLISPKSSRLSITGVNPKLGFANFTTTSKLTAQIPLEPTDLPFSPLKDDPGPGEFKKVSSAVARDIFGRHIDRQKANSILRTLQEQRINGTLDVGIPSESETSLSNGLEWLRANYPLDEDAAIIARLEREEAQVSQSFIDGGVKWGVYEPTDPAKELPSRIPTDSQGNVIYKPQQDPERNRVLGTSFIEERKKAVKAVREAEEAAKKAEQEAAEVEAIRIGKPLETAETRALVRRREVQKKKEDYTDYVQSVFGPKQEGGKYSWPNMSSSERLWPSAVFTAAVIGLSLLFGHYYTPPSRKARLWPDIPPAAATLATLIGINFLVFAAWRVVPLQRTLFKYALSVPGYPRAFTMLGNCFSHQKFMHLAMNMSVLWIFGTRLHDDIGRGPFLATYMICGASSSFVSLTAHVFTRSFSSGALGASGAVSGIVAAWSVSNSQ